MSDNEMANVSDMMATLGWDAAVYRNSNNDLAHFVDEELAQHFVMNGFREQRKYSNLQRRQLNIERKILGDGILIIYGWADREISEGGVLSVIDDSTSGKHVASARGYFAAVWRDDVSGHLQEAPRRTRFGFIGFFDMGETVAPADLKDSILLINGGAYELGEVERDKRDNLDLMIEMYRNLEGGAVYDELLLILNESRGYLNSIAEVHAREISSVIVHEVYDSQIESSPDISVAAVVLGNAAQLKAWMINLCRNTAPNVAVDLLCNGPLEANEVIMAAKWLGEVMGRQVRIFLVNRNIGFNGGVNALVRRSNSKYMLISNTDVRYSNLDFDRMKHLAKDGAIVAPRQFNSMGALQHLGLKIKEEKKLIHGKILTFVQSELIGRNTYPAEDDSRERVVQYFGAAAFFATTATLYRLGPFDSGFIYAYHEDTDLAHRHNEMGGRVVVSAALDIIHYESSASQVDLPKTFMIAANTIRIGKKIGMDHRTTEGAL